MRARGWISQSAQNGFAASPPVSTSRRAAAARLWTERASRVTGVANVGCSRAFSPDRNIGVAGPEGIQTASHEQQFGGRHAFASSSFRFPRRSVGSAIGECGRPGDGGGGLAGPWVQFSGPCSLPIAVERRDRRHPQRLR